MMIGTGMDSGIRDEVDMAQFVKAQVVPNELATLGETTFAKLAAMFPDPRDARIAQLEKALREIAWLVDLFNRSGVLPGLRLHEIGESVDRVMFEPETSMSITVEELSA